MRYASSDLRNEHEGILFGLKILEELVRRLKEAEPVELEDLREMVNFLKLFADKCHHGKEEGLYFPSLEKAGVPREGGPIGVMLAEHIEGRAYITRMKAAISTEFSPEEFSSAATSYIQLLRNHIDKENQVLFVMGDQRLAPDEQARLLDEFETFEEDIMGSGTHQILHQMLESFNQKYLN